MDFNTRISVTGKGGGLSLFWEKFRVTLPSFGLNSRRHLGFRSLLKRGFFRCRVNRYPNSVSTFQLTRLLISWDVHFNPGPIANKPSCQICRRTIARNHRSLYCETCGFQYHIKCGKVTPKQFVEISRDSISPWKCPACLQQFKLDYSLDVDTLLSLPFAAVSDESRSDLYDLQGNNHGETSDEEEECRQRGSHLLNLARKLEARSRKDLRVAHLNVCSLRNKIEELKCLQLICKFDILAITETHLDKSVLDMELQIDGMKVLRLDRRERKGGGCVIYYAEYLKATHRKDLARSGLEAIWLQVQFPCTSVLFSVIYRPPDAP